MGIFIAFAIAALVWAVWKGKLRTAQLPPVLIGLAGAFLAARGNFIIGIAAMKTIDGNYAELLAKTREANRPH